jgi:DinB superfamily
MTPDQRQTALTLLNASASAFLDTITPLTPAQWTHQPNPEQWSVAQVAEHVVLAEAALFRKVQALLAAPPNSEPLESTPATLAELNQVLAGRQGRVPAPPTILPSGTWPQTEVTERFLAHRQHLLAFIETNQQPLDHYSANNAFFGPLSAFHWLIYAPLHTQRHLLQINEILAHA